MMTGTIANHKLLLQPVDSPNFLPLLRLSAVVDSPDAHWRQLFINSRFQAKGHNFFLCSEERLVMKFGLKKEAVRVFIVSNHLLCRVCHPFTNLSWNKDPVLSNKGLLFIFHWRHPTFGSSPGSFQNVCHTMRS